MSSRVAAQDLANCLGLPPYFIKKTFGSPQDGGYSLEVVDAQITAHVVGENWEPPSVLELLNGTERLLPYSVLRRLGSTEVITPPYLDFGGRMSVTMQTVVEFGYPAFPHFSARNLVTVFGISPSYASKLCAKGGEYGFLMTGVDLQNRRFTTYEHLHRFLTSIVKNTTPLAWLCRRAIDPCPVLTLAQATKLSGLPSAEKFTERLLPQLPHILRPNGQPAIPKFFLTALLEKK